MRRIAIYLGMGLGRVFMLLWAALLISVFVAIGLDLVS